MVRSPWLSIEKIRHTSPLLKFLAKPLDLISTSLQNLIGLCQTGRVVCNAYALHAKIESPNLIGLQSDSVGLSVKSSFCIHLLPFCGLDRTRRTESDSPDLLQSIIFTYRYCLIGLRSDSVGLAGLSAKHSFYIHLLPFYGLDRAHRTESD